MTKVLVTISKHIFLQNMNTRNPEELKVIHTNIQIFDHTPYTDNVKKNSPYS